MSYKLIALIGKTGSGKSSLAQILAEELPNANMIVRTTTRPIRPYEVNGISYNFITHEEFIDQILVENMLEYTYYNDWFYGTPCIALNKTAINIGVFDPEAIVQLLKCENLDMKIYELEVDANTRLYRLATDSCRADSLEICRRMLADEISFSRIDFQTIKLNNTGLEDKRNNVQAILNDCENWVAFGQI